MRQISEMTPALTPKAPTRLVKARLALACVALFECFRVNPCGIHFARLLSRSDAVGFGEHTRPRVCRPAPSPVGTGALGRQQTVDHSDTLVWLARRQPQHARARALPDPTELFRLGLCRVELSRKLSGCVPLPWTCSMRWA